MLTQEVIDQVVGTQVKLSLPVMAALMLYPWPGGEAELREGLGEAARLAGARPVGREHLPTRLAEALPRPPARHLLEWFNAETESRFLTWCVRHSGLPKTRLARELGITRSALYKKLERFGIAYKDGD